MNDDIYTDDESTQPHTLMVHKSNPIWQESFALAKYLLEYFENVVWSNASQIRRSAMSIPNNIAEGLGQRSDLNTLRFFGYARGSLLETDTGCYMANKVGIMSDEIYARIEAQCIKILELIDLVINTDEPIEPPPF